MNFTIIILTLLSVLPLLTTDIYLPAFPSIADHFHVAAWQVQSTMGAYLLGLSCAQVFYGPLSDRFGRRPLLLGGLFIYALCSLGCAVAPSIFLLQIFRFGQAIGACAGLVLARAMVVDMYSQKESAHILSLIYPIVGISPIVAPILGGFLTEYFGWRSIFYILTLLATGVWASTFFHLKESKNSQRQVLSAHQIASNFLILLKQRKFLAYTATIVFAYAAYFAYLSQAPFAFKNLGVGLQLGSLFYAPTAASYIIGTIIGRRILARKNLERVVLTGCVTFVLGALAFVFIANAGISTPWQLFLPMCVVTAGNGMILSFSMAGALAKNPAIAGTASGLIGSLQLAGASLSSTLLGSVFPATLPVLATMIFISTLSALIFFVFLTRPLLGLQPTT